MKKLTDITWPLIHQMASEEIEQYEFTNYLKVRSNASTIVVEAAVMLEAGWTDIVDEVSLAESHE